MNDDKLSYSGNQKKLLLKTSIFNLMSVTRKSKDKKNHDFVFLDAPDWVTIIPLLKEKEDPLFLTVRQFRHGSGQLSLEFPAGTIDSGESPLSAAKRELQEESGFQAAEWIKLGSLNPNPAFMNNRVYFFLARKLEVVSGQSLDEHEIINVTKTALSEIEPGKNEFESAIMASALLFFERWRK